MTPASTTVLDAPPAALHAAPAPLTGLDRSSASLGDDFVPRHVGPSDEEVADMLALLGVKTLDELIDRTVPKAIRLAEPMALDAPLSEHDALAELKQIAAQNKVFRSYLGMGYTPCVTPPVIRRNILESPGWYTQYTPYQAEIAQGRLEALLNFQTMVSDLTGLPLANASLLDEATAAAEAMAMCRGVAGGGSSDDGRNTFFVSEDCHPQTIAVVQTRGRSMGIDVVVGNEADLPAHVADLKSLCGVLVQYPTSDGRLVDYSDTVKAAHDAGALVVFAADILALVLVKSPGEWGADIAVGSTQRFGVPMGFGGPHAAYLATKPEYARKMPGRIVGVSKDAHGNPAYRLAIQTREQHIRREKATSNICTAQVLLAVMAGMYAVWHGPEGLIRIAKRVHGLTRALAMGLERLGIFFGNDPYFDTLRVHTPTPKAALRAARERGMNLRAFSDGTVGVTLDETTTAADVAELVACFNPAGPDDDEGRFTLGTLARESFASVPSPGGFARGTKFLQHPVFNRYHSETEMMRYIKRLESRDLSLTHSMIPLGSCTMKLNAAAEMLPVTWPEFGGLHPFAPADQTQGYQQLFADLERWLSKITGFAATSLQPNAGSQGEYAGLLAIRGYHESRGEAGRNVCLIPVSAHGTNPSSAVIAGMKVVVVACDADGNIDVADLTKKADAHAKDLSALMITYPSTHGVFEENVREVCGVVHAHGGQVYMDGANMNAQVGLTSPGDIGADVCHLNLHKTFCIPHGGGGPGMGPICVAKHLAPFLPGHPLGKSAEGKVLSAESGGGYAKGSPSSHSSSLSTQHSALSTSGPVGPVSAAPYGSPSILVIPWMYIRMMGGAGLTHATKVAILNANYIAKRLEGHYPTLFKGRSGFVAHEAVMDCRAFEASAGVKVEDVAKRLMDYGFHAPTMSWPVPGTLMIEPTESESKAELDRFCDAMLGIRDEIRAVEEGKADRADNPLKHAPHTAAAVTADAWSHKYGRQQAAFPKPWLKEHKFWPAVGRIDNPYGDRNLVCTCPPIDTFQT
jgi:glycine dehydrogenase